MSTRSLVPLTEADQLANARYGSALAHRYLQHLGFSGRVDRRKRAAAPATYPVGLLLEIAAIARIYEWEQAGIKHLIDPALPSAGEALESLNRRFVMNPQEVLPGRASLLSQVLLAWRRTCAVTAVAELGCDFVYGAHCRDELDTVLRLVLSLSTPKSQNIAPTET